MIESEKFSNKGDGAGSGQDIKHHRILTQNKKKPNKLTEIGFYGHTVREKFASNFWTNLVLASGVQSATPMPERESKKYSNKQQEEAED